MKHLLSRALSIAASCTPLFAVASYAKDLTPAELVNMSECSAVRIGCGISYDLAPLSVGVDGNTIATTYCAVAMASALVAILVRLLPKEPRAVCWAILKKVTFVYFILGWVPLCIAVVFWESVATYAVLAMYLITALIWTPICIFKAWVANIELLYMTAGLIIRGVAKLSTIYVRVEGRTVTLKQGSQTITRVVEPEESVQVAGDSWEVEECLSR